MLICGGNPFPRAAKQAYNKCQWIPMGRGGPHSVPLGDVPAVIRSTPIFKHLNTSDAPPRRLKFHLATAPLYGQ